jgi:sulfur carrier protein ThiS
MHQVTVSMRGREKPWTRKFRARSDVVEEIVKELGINPLEILIRLNGEFVPDTEKAKAGDKIELLQITSRG